MNLLIFKSKTDDQEKDELDDDDNSDIWVCFTHFEKIMLTAVIKMRRLLCVYLKIAGVAGLA